jgi:hypothetical protein
MREVVVNEFFKPGGVTQFVFEIPDTTQVVNEASSEDKGDDW